MYLVCNDWHQKKEKEILLNYQVEFHYITFLLLMSQGNIPAFQKFQLELDKWLIDHAAAGDVLQKPVCFVNL